jgi:histidine triad (HIT) family protein
MEDIFCKISNKTAPAFIVDENEKAIAFLDHEPLLPGHMLIITREHADDIFSLSDEQLIDVCRLAKRTALALRASFGYQDIAIFSNNGPRIQDVKHFHLHVTGKKSDAMYPLSSVRDLVKDQERLLRAVHDLREE